MSMNSVGTGNEDTKIRYYQMGEITADWIRDDIYIWITDKYGKDFKSWTEGKWLLVDIDVYLNFGVKPFFKDGM